MEWPFRPPRRGLNVSAVSASAEEPQPSRSLFSEPRFLHAFFAGQTERQQRPLSCSASRLARSESWQYPMKKRYALALTAFVCVVTLLAAARASDTQTVTDRNADKAIVSVPEPVTLLLLGSGLVALTAGRRLAKRKRQVSLPAMDKQ